MQSESMNMDLIGGLFQSQAERLEAQYHEQLHNRRVIEQCQNEVISTACMVQSLEQQAQAQTQQIEINLQRSLHVYELAASLACTSEPRRSRAQRKGTPAEQCS